MANNNEALMVRVLSIDPIPNKDLIVKCWVGISGVKVAQVVTRKEGLSIGDEFVYFDSNLCLTDELLKVDPELATYLAKGIRVKTIRLGGTVSDGLIIRFKVLFNFDKNFQFKEGETFTEIKGKKLCYKYIPPVKMEPLTRSEKRNKKGIRKAVVRPVEGQWNFHIDTAHLLRNMHRLDPETRIAISTKFHGTSAIFSNALVYKNLNIFQKLLKLLRVPIKDREYQELAASRTVIKTKSSKSGFYKEDLWSIVGKEEFGGLLFEGETVYYEIYGFTPSGSAIQKGWEYGCKPNEMGNQYKLAVYRITMTDPDGTVHECTWDEVKKRCAELEVPYVEELYVGKAKDLFALDVDTHWHANFADMLCRKYFNWKRKDCTGVWNEGVVIRNLDNPQIEVYKLKDPLFVAKESEAYEKGETNIEDQESSGG